MRRWLGKVILSWLASKPWKWVCREVGHSFTVTATANWNGSFAHLLNGATCKRCGSTYEDAYNRGEVSR